MNNYSSAFPSEEYDKKIRSTIPFYEDIYQQIAELVNAFKKQAMVWLDVGCGTGKMAETAAQCCPVKHFCLCDISEEMLKGAQIKLRNYGEKIAYYESSVLDLSDIAKFDVVTAVLVNHYLNREERMRAVRRCYRALKPGGIFVTVENMAPNSRIGRDIGLKRWQQYQMNNGISQQESQRHMERYGSGYFPISISDQLQLISDGGFETVEVFWVSYLQAGFYAIK